MHHHVQSIVAALYMLVQIPSVRISCICVHQMLQCLIQENCAGFKVKWLSVTGLAGQQWRGASSSASLIVLVDSNCVTVAHASRVSH